ncbi:DUF6702 family protein [Thalassomonas actiniarum]|uniref:Orphan protein n=1 Tax=Thalassomonas actiniarum TaxID=485447 RepID=A0AAE9YNZ3_9GAMM|nr:DUF6702 family protein [Thalassomonas actiniarum]WDD98340.1 hypothetical protein SG35_024220 [Thalassomonas actiniarum]
MLKSLLLCLVFSAYWGAAPAAAHNFFFGITDLSVNPSSKHIEIIHQFTAHDIENAIAEQQQTHFSPEHKNYQGLIRQLFEQNFSVMEAQRALPLSWVGLEVVRGKVFVYQEGPAKNFLSGLVVKNTLLVDTYPEQINTLNYQDNDIKGSLTFTQLRKIAKIESNN